MTFKSISFAPDILIKVSKCPGLNKNISFNSKSPGKSFDLKISFDNCYFCQDLMPDPLCVHLLYICELYLRQLHQAFSTNSSIEIALGCKSSRFELTLTISFLPWWDARSDVHNKMHWSPINSHSTTFSIMQWVFGIIPAHFARFPLSVLWIIDQCLCLS